MQAFIVYLVCLSRSHTRTCFQKLTRGKTKASFSVNIFSWSLRWVMCDSSPVFECRHFKFLKKGIKVTLVSVPVLPSPSAPCTVYRRPLSIMLFGGRGGDLSITILTAAYVWLPTRSRFIEGAACCLYNGSTNLFWSFANHRWRAMQSFIWLCLIRSRMAYEQQKLSSAQGGQQTSPIFVTWWSTEKWRHIRFEKSASSSLSELQDGRSGVYGFFFLVTTTDTQLLILNTRDVTKLLDYLF